VNGCGHCVGVSDFDDLKTSSFHYGLLNNVVGHDI
jgi:hypothetical protein